MFLIIRKIYLLLYRTHVIPKSVKPERMKQNLDILDFTLSADDMARIKTLDTDKPFLLGSHEDPEIVKWFMQYKNA